MAGEIADWWDRNAADYQAASEIPVDIHYGPGSPNEAELNLLGEVAGKAVLDLGCGGGQCSVAFALRGASVTGIDFAAGQLALAKALAAEHGVAVDFLQRGLVPPTVFFKAVKPAG